MSKPLGFFMLAAVVIAGGYFLFRGTQERGAPSDTTGTGAAQSAAGTSPAPAPAPATAFETPKKSAHFESSTPAHGAVLAVPPLNIVIDVNFDLVTPSKISITKDGTEYGTGDTAIDTNRLALRRAMKAEAPDGVYTVEYTACWPDKSCHDGHFQFAVDRSLRASFSDQTSSREVSVRLKDIAFVPQNIRVRPGTTVVWTNDDAVEHYVNTDSHPAHTYFPAQNSQALKTGDTYRLTFSTPGIYPYHCSAHADTMSGAILVEE